MKMLSRSFQTSWSYQPEVDTSSNSKPTLELKAGSRKGSVSSPLLAKKGNSRCSPQPLSMESSSFLISSSLNKN